MLCSRLRRGGGAVQAFPGIGEGQFQQMAALQQQVAAVFLVPEDMDRAAVGELRPDLISAGAAVGPGWMLPEQLHGGVQGLGGFLPEGDSEAGRLAGLRIRVRAEAGWQDGGFGRIGHCSAPV